ncbi:RidA family protein [Povalibacter sp.]|uniref:RidA family protein n=1 Tax=Povalibacter sp. TaxID=1962978 RepID=UPI002F3E5A92
MRVVSVRPVLALTVGLSLAGPVLSAEPARPEFLNTPESLARNLPFSEAVRAGDFMFLAGQIGDKDGKVVPGGIAAEARQTLQHIKDVLERNGSSLGDVVKCTVFLADIAEWPAFNTVYREFFKQPFPARSAFAASGLAMNARVEVECIAYVPR